MSYLWRKEMLVQCEPLFEVSANNIYQLRLDLPAMWKQAWLSLFRFYPFEEEAVMLGCRHQGLRLLHPVSDPHPKGVALSLSAEVAVRAQLLDPRSRQEDGARCVSVIPSPWVWAPPSDSFLMNRLQQRWCDVILEIRSQKDYGLSSLPPTHYYFPYSASCHSSPNYWFKWFLIGLYLTRFAFSGPLIPHFSFLSVYSLVTGQSLSFLKLYTRLSGLPVCITIRVNQIYFSITISARV